MNSSKNTFWFWVFISPIILAFSLVVLIPFFIGIYFSFTDWTGFGTTNFVGLENYARIRHDTGFINALWFTARFSLVSVITVNAVGLSLALIVTRKFKLSNSLRTIFFMPNLIGGLILGFIWQFIFLDVFPVFGLGHWTSTPQTSFWGLVIMTTWQMSGYMMVIYIAYLQNVPIDILEAASVDGVTPMQKFRNITMPLIAPAFTISIFMTLSNSFRMFDQNLSLTNGGPFQSSVMVALDIYNTAFARNQLAYAQSKAVVFFIIILCISLTQAYISKKREVEM
jgi:raffinose/stachyose/melibiose transport system permease protein